MYIQNGAYTVRGFFNNQALVLESYEGNSNYEKVRAKMEENGRIPGCTNPDYTKDNITEAFLKLSGLTFNFIFLMKKNGILIPFEQCLGSKWTEFFKTHYLKYSEDPDHYELKQERVPPYVQIPPSNGKTIFRFTKVHRDLVLKAKSKFEIKQPE